MIVIAGLVLGILTGTFTARRRGGSATDMAHYAAIHGIAGMLLGLFLTLFLGRMLL
jgi:hypothetical protein